MSKKYDHLDAHECEALIKSKCESLKNCIGNPFRPQDQFSSRMATAQDIVWLIERKFNTYGIDYE